MSTRRGIRALAAAAAVATALLLSGCDADGDGIDDETGQPVAVAAPTGDTSSRDGTQCDPHGFGPLSGCSGSAENQDEPTFAPDDEVTAQDMAETARHEAWHLAAARCSGWRIVSSELHPDGSGSTATEVPAGAPLNQVLMLDVAGAVADGTDEYSLDDLSQAGAAMGDADIPPPDRDRLVAEARAEAARCAATRADEIDRDAADLLKDGELG